MIIRAASAQQASLLSTLALRSKAVWGYSAEFMEACRAELTVSPEMINSADYRFAVAESHSEILGFYGLERQSKSDYELEALFVEPRHIGHGIGRMLIQHAISYIASSGGRRLLIQGDPNAEHFYQAAGAVRVGLRESGSIAGRVLPLFEVTIDNQD